MQFTWNFSCQLPIMNYLQVPSNLLNCFYLILQLLNFFPKDLLSLKRAQVRCFYMGIVDLSLALVQQVPLLPKIII